MSCQSNHKKPRLMPFRYARRLKSSVFAAGEEPSVVNVCFWPRPCKNAADGG